MVRKLVFGVEKEKALTYMPYSFHLYRHNECVREKEVVELDNAKTILEIDVALLVGELL